MEERSNPSKDISDVGGGAPAETTNPSDCLLDRVVQEYEYDAVSQMGFSEEMQDLIFEAREDVHIENLVDDITNEKKKLTRLKEKKKENKNRRRDRKLKKNSDILNLFPLEKREKKGLVYSKKEMEALRFEELENQKKMWIEVYCGLCPVVAQEYDGLVNCGKDRDNSDDEEKISFDCGEISFDFDPRLQFPRASVAHAPTGAHDFQLPDNYCENLSSLDSMHTNPVNDEISYSDAEVEYTLGNSSDEDYSSIQRPAFLVTGEPDFDSGPPQDGLEYLRRVRWEASHIPQVTIARIEKNKLNKEQTIYMPQVPDIMKCPVNLLPLKEWEDWLLTGFSELRLGFSQIELRGYNAEDFAVFQSVVIESFENATSGVNTSPSDAPTSMHLLQNSNSTSDFPNLSAMFEMQPATRTLALKRQITSIENMATLSRADCLMLFALLVSVDMPLDADTSAAIRSLLRKCASLRALKETFDDEVMILNIFATISGRYFGQIDQ